LPWAMRPPPRKEGHVVPVPPRAFLVAEAAARQCRTGPPRQSNTCSFWLNHPVHGFHVIEQRWTRRFGSMSSARRTALIRVDRRYYFPALRNRRGRVEAGDRPLCSRNRIGRNAGVDRAGPTSAPRNFADDSSRKELQKQRWIGLAGLINCFSKLRILLHRVGRHGKKPSLLVALHALGSFLTALLWSEQWRERAITRWLTLARSLSTKTKKIVLFLGTAKSSAARCSSLRSMHCPVLEMPEVAEEEKPPSWGKIMTDMDKK
jgi:hypothetical protein